MTTIFLSYARKDSEKTQTLVEKLQDLGFEVWIDNRGIGGGKIWSTEIENAIADCDVFLLCISQASVASDNVRREIHIAFSNGKPIIPLRLEQVNYPRGWGYELAGIQWIDYDKDWDSRLLAAIGHETQTPHKIDHGTVAPPDRQPKPLLLRWTFILASLLLFMLVFAYARFTKPDIDVSRVLNSENDFGDFPLASGVTFHNAELYVVLSPKHNSNWDYNIFFRHTPDSSNTFKIQSNGGWSLWENTPEGDQRALSSHTINSPNFSAEKEIRIRIVFVEGKVSVTVNDNPLLNDFALANDLGSGSIAISDDADNPIDSAFELKIWFLYN